MKFKRVKYYLLMFTMVLLFGAYIGVSFFATPTSADTTVPSDDPTAGLTPDEEQPDASDEDNNTSNDDFELPTNAIDLVNYALNIYNNGAGSTSTIEYVVQNTGIWQGVEVGVVQYAVGNTYRCGSESLEDVYFYYADADPLIEGLLLSNNLVMQEYRAINTDTEKNSFICVGTEDYNVASRTYNLNADSGYKKSYSMDQGLEKHVIVYSMEFPLEITKDTVEVKTYDTRSNKNYTIVKFSYKIDKLPDELDYYYKKNGSLPVVTYTQYDYTFVISKSTGQLKRMIREETFTSYTTSVPGGLTINSKATFSQTFTSMDKSVEVPKPYLTYKKDK